MVGTPSWLIRASIRRWHQQPRSQSPPLLLLALQLQVGRLQQLALGHPGRQSLAEHAQLGLAHIPFPGHALGRAELAEPGPFPHAELHGLHQRVGAVGLHLDQTQGLVEAFPQ
jgi:hypothetical protein